MKRGGLDHPPLDEDVEMELADEPQTVPLTAADPQENIIVASESQSGKKNLMNQIGDMKVKNHFSLCNPASTISFAQSESILLVDNLEQISLEKSNDNDYLVVKQATISSPGLVLMRAAYTLVALLMTGFVFIICVQLILFLFLGLAIESGLTSQNGFKFFTFFGTLLSLRIFINGLSQAMVIADAFVLDTWKGSKLMKTVIHWDSTLVDWISMFVFIGFPVLIGSVALCSGSSIWWTITSISWFLLVLAYYLVFLCSAVFYEVNGCLELVRFHPLLRDGCNPDSDELTFRTLKRIFLLRMRQKLCGVKHVTYQSHGNDPQPAGLSYDQIHEKESYRSWISSWSRFTRLSCMSCLYTTLETKRRQYNIEDALEFTPFVTNDSWSLESIYCRNRETRFIAIIDGKSAITRDQAKSSRICFIFGILVTLFVIVGLTVWMEFGAIAVVVVIAIYVLIVYKTIRKSIAINAAYKEILSRDGGGERSVNRNGQSDSLYQMNETFRITDPSDGLCWFFFYLEFITFVVLPAIALFAAQNTRVGIVFIVMGFFHRVRDMLSAPACLRELGSLEGIEINNREKSDLGEWREKHRLSRIVSEISVGNRSKFWRGVFILLNLVFILLCVFAIKIGVSDGSKEVENFASGDEFEYLGSKSFSYASCSLSHNIKDPAGRDNSLLDFTFLSSAAYLDNSVTDEVLNQWFGYGVVENLVEDVDVFRKTYQEEHGSSSVTYKLFNFPGRDDLKIVAVRGTNNAWDALTDAQLWSSAFLAQMVRTALPFGAFWTPILPYLVKAVSVIEDKALKDISYYRETTAFVKMLKGKGFDVQITGHSLGGGIAMITGTQEKIPSVGLSGPNNLISRLTFNPTLEPDDLDQYTFNIIPDRDPVPRIDDLSENYQRIKCRADSNRPVDCHSSSRSLCEILYTCGSAGRPIPCICHDKYDFPIPSSKNMLSYSDYCPNQKDN